MSAAKKAFARSEKCDNSYLDSTKGLETQLVNTDILREDFEEQAIIDPMTEKVLDRYIELATSGKMKTISAAEFDLKMEELGKKKPAWETHPNPRRKGNSAPV